MTGAPIPDGADAIVMVEWTQQGNTESEVAINQQVSGGQHIRKSGEDLVTGDLVMRSGTLLNAAHLGLLASLGIYQVDTVRTPSREVLSQEMN